MNDPYNSAQPDPSETIEFEVPSLEETGRFRRMIDLHRELPAEYDRQRRAENAGSAR